MLENVISIKQQRSNGTDLVDLTKLLIEKEEELKKMLKDADKQAKINEEITAIKDEIERHNHTVRQFEGELTKARRVMVSFPIVNFLFSRTLRNYHR